MAKVIPPMDFRFNGKFSSPFLSAPSTPKRFGGGGHYLVGDPTSPGHLPDFDNGDLDDFSISSSSVIPFEWEEKPGTPNLPPEGNDSSFEDDFAFRVSDQTGKSTLPAEELFDGGKIRPLKPPPKPQPSSSGLISKDPKRTEQERGRERVVSSLNNSRNRRGTTRSLSPLRVSAYPWEDEEGEEEEERQPLRQNSKQKGCRKWRLKDFFLFRSASEGRASEKDPIRKYRTLLKKHEDEKKSSSFRSIEGSSNSNRRAAVSAHELHYTVNRAISEDLKKKTFLPYKQGILGRLAFNPAVHALANGFGFSRRR